MTRDRLPGGGLWVGPYVRSDSEAEPYSMQVPTCSRGCGTEAVATDEVCSFCDGALVLKEGGVGSIPKVSLEGVMVFVGTDLLPFACPDPCTVFWLPNHKLIGMRNCLVSRDFAETTHYTPKQIATEIQFVVETCAKSLSHIRSCYMKDGKVRTLWGMVGIIE